MFWRPIRIFTAFIFSTIVWARPDGGISITYVLRGDSRDESVRLKDNGSIPQEFSPVAFDVPVTLNRSRRNHWRWDNQAREIKDDLTNPVGELRRSPRAR